MASFTKVLKFQQLWFLVVLLGCSGMEQSERQQLRRQNAKGEFIYRNSDERRYTLFALEPQTREKYPWELAYAGKHPKLNKEFFRCKGSALNPPHIDHKDPARMANYFDCGGAQKHSLPIREGKEFIYPVLIELLNFVQGKTGHKVIVTCGHRCPVHNAYADSTVANQHSKHLIGAEVDFYVQGMENCPEEIIDLLIGFYRDSPEYQGNKHYREFQRLGLEKTNVSTPPWYNQEVLIKLYHKTEGRDFDNRHPYPYLSLQVRFDRELNEKVISSWEKGFHNYLRY